MPIVNKIWAYVIIALVVIVIMVCLGIYFYRQGKKTTSIQSLPGQLPGDKNSANVNGASNDEIKNLVNALYQDMSGLNVFGHDMDIYKSAILLGDSDLVELYNSFNSRYQTQSGQTLTAWLSNEYYTNSSIPDSLVARLQKLNCT